VLTQAGVPIYGDGHSITLVANGYMPGDKRFGFEFQGGQSGRKGLSTANINHFTVDGHLRKLATMDIVDNFDPRHSGPIKNLHLRMRAPSSGKEIDSKSTDECEIWFEMAFKIEANVNALIVKVHEIYEQGFVHGWCFDASS